MKKKIILLVTCVGGKTAPVLLDCLKKSINFSYSLIGVDSYSPGGSKRFLDNFHYVPKGSDKEYIGRIIDILKKERVDFFIPGSDDEAICVSKNMKLFIDIGVVPMVSDHKVINLISNKYETYKALSDKGVRVPEYKLVRSKEELVDAMDGFGYPEVTVISKPVDGRGGRGLYVFEGNDKPPLWLGSGQREKRIELQGVSDELLEEVIKRECLVMPALSAPAYDADVVAVDGRTKLVVVRERINPSGIPFKGNKIHSNKSLTKYCHDIATALGLDSIHDIDLMTNKNGDPCVIEVNPRPSGSMAASLIAGIPVIDMAILAIQGEEIMNVNLERDVFVALKADGSMKIATEGNEV